MVTEVSGRGLVVTQESGRSLVVINRVGGQVSAAGEGADTDWFLQQTPGDITTRGQGLK